MFFFYEFLITLFQSEIKMLFLEGNFFYLICFMSFRSKDKKLFNKFFWEGDWFIRFWGLILFFQFIMFLNERGTDT